MGLKWNEELLDIARAIKKVYLFFKGNGLVL